MIAFDRESWILTGFVLLFVAAITVSVCGWLLLWRTRRRSDEPGAPPEEATAPLLPPGNPLR